MQMFILSLSICVLCRFWAHYSRFSNPADPFSHPNVREKLLPNLQSAENGVLKPAYYVCTSYAPMHLAFRLRLLHTRDSNDAREEHPLVQRFSEMKESLSGVLAVDVQRDTGLASHFLWRRREQGFRNVSYKHIVQPR